MTLLIATSWIIHEPTDGWLFPALSGLLVYYCYQTNSRICMPCLAYQFDGRTQQSYWGYSKRDLELFLAALTIWISAVGTVCLHCMKGVICWPDSFSKYIKCSCLNYLLLKRDRTVSLVNCVTYPFLNCHMCILPVLRHLSLIMPLIIIYDFI